VDDLPAASFGYATSRAVKIDSSRLREAPFLEPGGALLLWTTSPERLAADLAPGRLRLEATVPIPGSRERAIGVFRKS
jgi:hypothetical protein